jgi:hypothetical protein
VVTQRGSNDGIPIDHRSEQQIGRAAQDRTVGDFEWAAARVVARFTGERTELIDDGTKPGLVDIRINHADRDAAYLEVVTDIEQPYAQMWAMVVRGELDRDEPLLERFWQVALSRILKRRPQALLKELIPLLQAMERSGEVFEYVVDRQRLALSHSTHAQRLLSLGVAGVGSRQLNSGETMGHLRFVPEGIVGPLEPNWERFLEWVETFLSSTRLQDVRTKLRDTGADERHVFIGASYTSPGEVFVALSEEHVGEVPSQPPALPDEITHLWVWNAQSPARCIVWFPGRGWRDAQQHWMTN